MIGVGCESVIDRVIEQGAPSVTVAGLIAILTLTTGCDISSVLPWMKNEQIDFFDCPSTTKMRSALYGVQMQGNSVTMSLTTETTP